MGDEHHSACPNKADCGSCTWSYIPYEQQLEKKLELINQSFSQHALSLYCEEIIASPKTAHYRNRMDFKIDFEGRVGLHAKGKWWRVIDNHMCFLGDEPIESCFVPVREWARSCGLSFFDRKKHVGLLRYAVIRAARNGSTLLSLVTSKPSCDAEHDSVQTAMLELAQAIYPHQLVWSINHTSSDTSVGDETHALSGDGYLVEEVSGFRYRISPHSFFQTNSYAAPALLDTVLEYVRHQGANSVLDLYCGSGFFTIPLAAACSSVAGVEVVQSAIDDAAFNAALNSSTAVFRCMKSEDYDLKSSAADVWVVDPPRAGLHKKVLSFIIESGPASIVYVSCNFKNFAAELVALKSSYSVRAMRAIDMFPHTPHVELVALLERNCAAPVGF